MKFDKKLSIWDAVDQVLSHVRPVEGEMIPMMDSLDRILSEDIYTAIDQPPFPRSAMDGYAVKVNDLKNASKENPVSLKVVGCQYAGAPYFRPLMEGEALRIMTGAAVPAGADVVIRQEDTDLGEDKVEIYVAVKEGANICGIGEDFPKGDCLARKGDRVDAYVIAAAVAGGLDQLPVRKRVKVAVITTGDELQVPGSPLVPGKIYNSNLALFASRLTQLGCQVRIAKAAGDNLHCIMESVKEAKDQCNLIITTGGVSVGQRDLIPDTMETLGADIIFHGISIKPGMPSMFSVYDNVPVLSLSGNPFAASAVFELLVQPLLKKMTLSNETVLKKVEGIAKDNFGKKSLCTRFLRGYYEDGSVSFMQGQGNGVTKSGIACNCLICIEAGQGEVQVGHPMTAYLL